MQINFNSDTKQIIVPAGKTKEQVVQAFNKVKNMEGFKDAFRLSGTGVFSLADFNANYPSFNNTKQQIFKLSDIKKDGDKNSIINLDDIEPKTNLSNNFDIKDIRKTKKTPATDRNQGSIQYEFTTKEQTQRVKYTLDITTPSNTTYGGATIYKLKTSGYEIEFYKALGSDSFTIKNNTFKNKPYNPEFGGSASMSEMLSGDRTTLKAVLKEIVKKFPAK